MHLTKRDYSAARELLTAITSGLVNPAAGECVTFDKSGNVICRKMTQAEQEEADTCFKREFGVNPN